MIDRNDTTASDSKIEEILRNAPPRPTPSDEDVLVVRKVVEAEWRAVSGRRRTRKRLVSFAAAASIVLAVAVGVALLRVPSALPVQVAAIDRSAGSIYLVGEQSQLQEMTDLAELHVGQILGTGSDSRVSLAWLSGGSLRIDEGSRVELTSPTEIFLRQGRVYFDTLPVLQRGRDSDEAIANFAIRTEYGLVQHLGTQYMTGISKGGITVSVREGEVRVAGNFFDAKARAGQQVTLEDTNEPSYSSISRHGEHWRWVEKMAPAVDVDERSAYEFIRWVARETGLEVRFASESAERMALETGMVGTVDREPRVALRALLKTTTLESSIENGRIIISER